MVTIYLIDSDTKNVMRVIDRDYVPNIGDHISLLYDGEECFCKVINKEYYIADEEDCDNIYLELKIKSAYVR